jgi:hypothetical protein
VGQGHHDYDKEADRFPFQLLPTADVFHCRESVVCWSTKAKRLLPTHARLLCFVLHHNLCLPRLPLDIHRPDSIPNVAPTGKLHPILFGPVRYGNRHDSTPDEGSTNKNSQGGVIERGRGSWSWDNVYGCYCYYKCEVGA